MNKRQNILVISLLLAPSVESIKLADVYKDGDMHPDKTIHDRNERYWKPDKDSYGDWWHHLGKNSETKDKFYEEAGKRPMVPSQNEEDDEPKNHPMGIGNFMRHRLSQVGAGWWDNGNGGGTEKWDSFEEAAHYSDNQTQFYESLREPKIASQNWNDAEPGSHPLGFTSNVQKSVTKKKKKNKHHNSLMQKESKWWDDENQKVTTLTNFNEWSKKPEMGSSNSQDQEPASLAQKKQKWWDNGNGGGSEKWDAFEEIARFSDNQTHFHEQARQPWISSLNYGDAEPTSHSIGITSSAQLPQQKRNNLVQKNGKWWHDGNGGGSEKWDAWEEIARFSDNQTHFHEQARQPWIRSGNGGDVEPTHHSAGITSSAQKSSATIKKNNLGQTNSKWWDNGNGGGSEKWDAFEEIARFSDNQTHFADQARQPWISSQNWHDVEPDTHPMGLTSNVQKSDPQKHNKNKRHNLGQMNSKWWHDGNGGGSEKWDAFEEMDAYSNSANEFHEKARQPWIASANKGDQEPDSHHQYFGQDEIYEDNGWQGQSFYKKLLHDKKHQHKMERNPSNHNHGDGFGNGFLQTEMDSQWWDNGNGGGTEKWDAFEEIARFSDNQTHFHEQARQPWISSLNSDDTAPDYHPNGFTESGFTKILLK